MSDIAGFLEKCKESIQRAREVLSQVISADGGGNGAQSGSGPRPLTDDQIEMARAIFGDSVNYDEVSINTGSWLAVGNGYISGWDSARPFVLGNTINTSGTLSDRTFIHEMMHIHQYQTQGWSYITDALADKGEYDYELTDLRAYSGDPDYEGRRLEQFGLEQQGQIVMDYFSLSQNADSSAFTPFTLSNGEEINSGNIDEYMELYQPYIDEIQAQRPLEGIDKEINELGEEVIRELGEGGKATVLETVEGIGEISGEINEGVSEIEREIAQGDTLGAVAEGGEMIIETGREGAEAVIETGGEVIEGVAETGWEVMEGGAEIGREAIADGIDKIKGLFD
ncbi:MAG: hypothetical protein KDD04_05265 [Sinomicrobium sp.]|nr:hypothetical protein [Sinomicrobium sp.]